MYQAHTGLGVRERRLLSYPELADKWSPATYGGILQKPDAIRRMAALPATPDANAIFAARDLFDDYCEDWWKRHGEYARLQPEYYAPLDLDERLSLDTTIKEVPGLLWIMDLFDRLGGWCDYVSAPLRRNPRLRLHRAWEGEIPTDAQIAKLADRIGRNPKTEVEIAIVVCIFERLPLPWRVRLVKLVEV